MGGVKTFFLLVCLVIPSGGAWACENGEAPPPPPSSTPSMSSSAPAAHRAPKPAVVAQLETLVDGLQMPSETDAPIHVFWTPDAPEEPKAADLARLSGTPIKAGAPVEMRTLSDLLDGPAQEEDWMRDDDKKTARRFAALRAFLEANFAEIEVVAWGDTEKQIVVAGRVEGGYAGFVTLIVET